MPEDFNGATPENSSRVGIEEFFNDPTLISLIDQALVGNQELRILNEDVQIASNEVLARVTVKRFVSCSGFSGSRTPPQTEPSARTYRSRGYGCSTADPRIPLEHDPT